MPVLAMDQDMIGLLGIDLGIGRYESGRTINEFKVDEIMAILTDHLGSFGGEFPYTFNGRGFTHALTSTWFPQKDHELILGWVADEVDVIVRPQGGVLLRPIGDRELKGKVRQDLTHPTSSIMTHFFAYKDPQMKCFIKNTWNIFPRANASVLRTIGVLQDALDLGRWFMNLWNQCGELGFAVQRVLNEVDKMD